MKVGLTKAKAGHKICANQKHASGVWDKYSPTGVLLGEEFCKETFDHSDGKAWARAVYNPKVHQAPKKLRDGEWYPTTKDRLRAYEKDPRSIFFAPRIAHADKCNVVHTDPNERMFPTEHQYDPSRFLGTLCSAVDVLWFTEDDKESKSSYADWAGSIEELSTPEHGVHKYFSDIVPGYYVKMDVRHSFQRTALCRARLIAELLKDLGVCALSNVRFDRSSRSMGGMAGVGVAPLPNHHPTSLAGGSTRARHPGPSIARARCGGKYYPGCLSVPLPPKSPDSPPPDNPLQTAPFIIARYVDARAKPTHTSALRRRRRSLARSRARCVAVAVRWRAVTSPVTRVTRTARHARVHVRHHRASRASSPFSAPPKHDRHARAAAAAALARSLDYARAVWRWR